MSYHRILKPFLPTVFSSHSLIRSLSTCEQHFTSRCGAQCVRLCGPSNRCLCNWLLDRLITNSHEMKGSGEETSILALLLLPCHRDKQASVSKPTKALHLKDDYSPTWEWKDHCVHSLYMYGTPVLHFEMSDYPSGCWKKGYSTPWRNRKILSTSISWASCLREGRVVSCKLLHTNFKQYIN